MRLLTRRPVLTLILVGVVLYFGYHYKQGKQRQQQGGAPSTTKHTRRAPQPASA
jgi:hypothetical protein